MPRWLADAMLGKLARYLRFLGHDTEYVSEGSEAERVDRARDGRRTLLTRDRNLSSKVEGSLLLRTTDVRGQLRDVHERCPSLPFAVRFDRCPECNLPLGTWTPPVDNSAWPREIPVALVRNGLAVRECGRCRRHFWEGSHSRRIRQVVAEALAPEAAP
jgi:uncharacterized protein with PIN domain